MIIGIRKEPNGSLYMDKNIYSKTENIKLSAEEFETFKQQNKEDNYTYNIGQEVFKKEYIIDSEINYQEEVVQFVIVTKRKFTDDLLSQPPYNYTKVYIDDEYVDCTSTDFNDDLTFSVEKYNARKLKEKDDIRIHEIEARLKKLDQDFRQADLGAVIKDLDERKAEFITLHNELRQLLGKPAREYKTSVENQDNQKSVEE